MASKGQPLGIGLGIDFSTLDADLNKVADRIEKVRREASIKVGSFAGLAASSRADKGGSGSGGMRADELAAQVQRVGISLSQGVASGVRTSSALLLSLGARMNSMLDRLAGTTITMFER